MSFPRQSGTRGCKSLLRAGYSQPPNPRVMNLLTSKKMNTHPQASPSQTNLPHRSLPTAWAGGARQKQGTTDGDFLFFLTYFYSVCECFPAGVMCSVCTQSTGERSSHAPGVYPSSFQVDRNEWVHFVCSYTQDKNKPLTFTTITRCWLGGAIRVGNARKTATSFTSLGYRAGSSLEK